MRTSSASRNARGWPRRPSTRCSAGHPTARSVRSPSRGRQARAVSEQPELSVARLSIEQGDASLAAAESDYKPDFLIQGGYMVMPDMTDAWMAKVGISWPKAPWSRGRVDARVNEARAEIEARRARLAVAESAVKLAVQQAYVRVQSAAERARILETSLLPQASQVLDVSRAAYQTDRVDFLSLIDNQRQLLDLRIQYFRARTEVEMAWADLERAVGVDLDREPLAPPKASNPMTAPQK
jgi:cobalt-zinc-cadmium efflux system outer membrane protein